MDSFDVKFTTTEGASPVICQRQICGKVYPPGTLLYKVHDSSRPDVAAREVCHSCRGYYKEKAKTLEQQSTKAGQFLITTDGVDWNH